MVRPGIGALTQARPPPLGIAIQNEIAILRTDRISGDGPNF